MKKKLLATTSTLAVLAMQSSPAFALPFENDTDVNVNYNKTIKFNSQAELDNAKIEQDKIIQMLNTRLDELRQIGKEAVAELKENGLVNLEAENKSFTEIKDLEEYINSSVTKIKEAIVKRAKVVQLKEELTRKSVEKKYEIYGQNSAFLAVEEYTAKSLDEALSRLENLSKVNFENIDKVNYLTRLNKQDYGVNYDFDYVDIANKEYIENPDVINIHSVEEYNTELENQLNLIEQGKQKQIEYNDYRKSEIDRVKAEGYGVEDYLAVDDRGKDVKQGLTDWLNAQTTEIKRYETAKAEYDKKKQAYNEAKAEYDTKKSEYDTAKAEYENNKATYDENKANYDKEKAEYDKAKSDYEAQKAEYDKAHAEWEANNQPTVTNQNEIDEANAENERIERENAQIRTEYEQALEDYNQNYKPKNTDTKIGGSDDTIAMYDTNKPTGEKDYYSKYVFNENKTATNSVDLLKPISITSDSKFGGTETSILKQGENQVEFTFNTVNDYLTLSNVGKVKINGEVKDLSLKIEGVASDSLVGKKFVVHKIASLYQDTLALNTTQLTNNDLKITFIADDKPVNLAGGLLIKSIDYDQESKVEWENQVFDYVDTNANLNKTAKGYRAKVNEKWNGNLPENSYMSVGYGSYVSVHHSTGVIQLFGVGSGDTKPNFGKPVEPIYTELKEVPAPIMSEATPEPVAPTFDREEPTFTENEPTFDLTEPEQPEEIEEFNDEPQNIKSEYGEYRDGKLYVNELQHTEKLTTIAMMFELPDTEFSNEYISDVSLDINANEYVLENLDFKLPKQLTKVIDKTNLTEEEMKSVEEAIKATNDFEDITITVNKDGSAKILKGDEVLKTFTSEETVYQEEVISKVGTPLTYDKEDFDESKLEQPTKKEDIKEIKKDEIKKNTPDTGDNTNLILPFTMLGISTFVLRKLGFKK